VIRHGETELCVVGVLVELPPLLTMTSATGLQ